MPMRHSTFCLGALRSACNVNVAPLKTGEIRWRGARAVVQEPPGIAGLAWEVLLVPAGTPGRRTQLDST